MLQIQHPQGSCSTRTRCAPFANRFLNNTISGSGCGDKLVLRKYLIFINISAYTHLALALWYWHQYSWIAFGPLGHFDRAWHHDNPKFTHIGGVKFRDSLSLNFDSIVSFCGEPGLTACLPKRLSQLIYQQNSSYRSPSFGVLQVH
jgi:hypothetical protein